MNLNCMVKKMAHCDCLSKAELHARTIFRLLYNLGISQKFIYRITERYNEIGTLEDREDRETLNCPNFTG